MSAFPKEPFFIPEFNMKSGGLDFLGMRQATLDLRDTCFPGFSNSTEFLRPFSLNVLDLLEAICFGGSRGLGRNHK